MKVPIKLRKDLTNCIARTNIPIAYFPGHYYRTFLWKDQASMLVNIECSNDHLEYDQCVALTTHNTWISGFYESGELQSKVPRYMGELHFINEDWCLEYVAHECFHAANNICRVLNLNPQLCIDLEERAAYIYGELVDAVYIWLWQTAPPAKDWSLWKRIKKVFFGKW